VPVTVDAAARPGALTLVVEVKGGGVSDRADWQVTIKRPPWLPDGFTAGSEETETDATGREFYREIVRGTVVFVLVPQRAGEPRDVPTFYILRDKVSRKLWADLMKADPTATPLSPVVGMTCAEAMSAAQKLGGLLPTVAQWDKAFGDKDMGRTDVAVNRRETGPRPVGDRGDRSAYDVRDMAGNGWELTRTLLKGGTIALDKLPADKDLIILRGRSWTAPTPLTLAELREQRLPQNALTQYCGAKNPYTGFRVVIEPPAP